MCSEFLEMEIEEAKENILYGIIHGYGLDHEWAVFEEIVEICGLDFKKFIEDGAFLEKELLENHYEDILLKDPYDEENPEYFKILYPIVLGAVILQIGARLPKSLQQKIIDINVWEIELKQRWRRPNKHHLEDEINALMGFQQMIQNHENGNIKDFDPYKYLNSRIEEEIEFYLRFFDTALLEQLTKEALEEKLGEIIKSSKEIIETTERQKEILLAEADVLMERKELIKAFKDLVSCYKNVF